MQDARELNEIVARESAFVDRIQSEYRRSSSARRT